MHFPRGRQQSFSPQILNSSPHFHLVRMPQRGKNLTKGLQISNLNAEKSLINLMCIYLSERMGFPVVSEAPDFRYIRFHVGTPNVLINGKQSNSTETYELRVNGDSQSVSITSNTSTGAFYGIQSLLNLMDENWESPGVTIKDAPRYAYRGMHLDVGRNFHSKEYVLKLLDLMAMYKLNKFYFHLTDDEGWRLEIPGLKELTTVWSLYSIFYSFIET